MQIVDVAKRHFANVDFEALTDLGLCSSFSSATDRIHCHYQALKLKFGELTEASDTLFSTFFEVLGDINVLLVEEIAKISSSMMQSRMQ